MDDEFTSLGVSFSLVGSSSFTGGAAPIIATEGGVKAAFASASGNNTPASSPVNSITSGAGPSSGCPWIKAFQADFAMAVSSVSVFVQDFDSIPGQELHMIAFDGSANEIARGTIIALGSGGDGAIQELSVSAPGIRRIKIDTDTINDNGIAFDDFSFLSQ